ncbi:Pr6Pr family membrane protein [Nonomuraea angiospora]|uniref:Pr6Pr family membrane protein n=1 Tax=Nonomuraea angiospora TaxID=46172 RepID=UPI0033F22CB0
MTAWRILLLTATVAGLSCLATSIGRPWAYFTVQSNIMLALYYGWRLITYRSRSASPDVKGAVTLYLLVTCLVNYISRDLANPLALLDGGTIRGLGNFLLHYVTPVMALVDWAAFDRSRPAHWAAPFAWLSYPLLYGAFVLLTAPNLPRRYVSVPERGATGLADSRVAGARRTCRLRSAGLRPVRHPPTHDQTGGRLSPH